MDKLLRGYSSPYNLGHKALENFFEGTVHIQEKIDGSQISFGMVQDQAGDWTLSLRSRRQEINKLEPQMFKLALETCMELFETNKLTHGYTYRGEYLSKNKHNTLVYDRVPKDYIIIYDIDKGDQDYMMPAELSTECERIGLEHVPYLATMTGVPSLDVIDHMIDNISVLGNVNMEGVVFKNYDKYDERDNKVLMAKFVSEKFRERHGKDWKVRNPGSKAFTALVIEKLATEARWAKARQHLREEGQLEDSMRDIPALMKEVGTDVYNEEGEKIKEELFKHYWKEIQRGITRGLPEWYKRVLAEESFQDE